MSKDHWTLSKAARVLTTFIAFVALMSSVLTVVLESSASATGAITEAATFPYSAESSGLSSMTVTTQAVGDLLIFQSQIHSQSITVASVATSGTGTTSAWSLAQRYVDTTNGVISEEIWWATVATAGSTVITATYSSSVGSISPELVVDSYHPAVAAPGWAVVASGGAAAASSTTINFPSLTSGTAAAELYWGYAESTGTPTAGSTTGFTYHVTNAPAGNLVAADPALAASTAYAPQATELTGNNATSIAAIFVDNTAAPATDTITFNSQGGSVASSISGPDTSTIALPPAPTFAGHTFNGWFAASSGGSALTSPYTLAGSTTLFAQWATNATDTITFNSQGGSAVTSMTGPNGSTITLPAVPTIAGNTSTGWFAASSGGAALTSPYTLASSTTLFAQWTTTDTIAFNSQGGSAVASMIGGHGGTITLPAAPTLAGNTFDGWFAASSGGSALTSPYTLAGSTTLFAQWTVTVGGGGGGGGPVPVTLTITAASQTVTAGSPVTASATVGGLTSPDTGTLTSATYTYAGSGTTVYAASTTAPAVAGTYSVTPSAATVSISPSTDASKYSTTYSYVGGVLTISAAVVVVPPVVVVGPHATRVVGQAFVGKSRTLTIVGSNFTANPGVTSNGPGAVVRVHSKSANRIVLSITVRKGTRPGTHLFTITASGKKCRIGYITR